MLVFWDKMISKIKIIISQVNKSKDGKVLASNFGYLMLLQISGYIFPLLTIPYLARVIGVEGFGKIAFAAAVMVWFKTVADWGFNYTATRDIAQNRDNPEKVSEIFSNVLWARMLLTLLSFTSLAITIVTVPYFRENKDILLVTFLLIPGHILFPEWFFQAMEKMKFITFFNLASKALFTVLVFVFIKEKSDFILQPLLITLNYAISGFFAMYIIIVKWKVKIIAPNFTDIYNTIKRSTDVFINNIMPNLYNSFSIVLLGFYGGSVSNGLLDAGSKFISIIQQFTTVISRVFFPFLSRRLDKHNIFIKINLTVSVISAVLLFFLAPILIKLFFIEEFYQAIHVLQIMSISIVFLALSNTYGTNYMIIKGYEKDLRNLTFCISLIGFTMSFPLIYFYDFIGAAFTITLTRGLLGISIMCRAKYIMKHEVAI